MEQPRKDNLQLPIFGVLFAAAIAGGLWWYQTPLSSSRPGKGESDQGIPVKREHVQARMWEDPFKAVSRHTHSERHARDVLKLKLKPHHLPENIATEGLGSPRPPVLVLPVMVDGNQYIESIETRLRSRYALISALGVAGYVPVAADRIGYFFWIPSEGNADHSSIPVPFEWFVPSRSEIDRPNDGSVSQRMMNSEEKPASILVLWVKDEVLTNQPLTLLEHLTDQVRKEIDKPSKNNTFVKILGPRTSTTLQAMVQEATKLQRSGFTFPQNSILPFPNVPVYSPWATAPDQALIGDLLDGRAPGELNDTSGQKLQMGSSEFFRGHIKTVFGKVGLELIRTINTDTELMAQIIAELERRGLDFTNGSDPKSRVVLISEWDTLYGRTLPKIFREVATKRGKTPPEINWYSYLRGLDGNIPQEVTQGQLPGQDQDGPLKGPETLAFLERPEGTSQLDYFRRLVTKIRQHDRQLWYSCDWKERLLRNCPQIKAIGVLGSDVYDKLLALQALRKNFPDAIFFTTDLDTRLLHPSQYEWTRNLVIASGFGLELNPEIVGEVNIPPFRDSYQTSLFFASLRAIGYIQVKYDKAEPPKSYYIPDHKDVSLEAHNIPRLYEVARHEALDLSIDTNTDDIHKPRANAINQHENGRVNDLILVVLGIALVIFALTPIWSTLKHLLVKEQDDPPAGKDYKYLVLGGLLIFLLTIALIIASQSMDGLGAEPVAFLSGVSVWPTEALRLLMLLLCIYFIIRATHRLEWSAKTLAEEFHLGQPRSISFGKWLKEVVRSPRHVISIANWFEVNQTSKSVDAGTLWKQYMDLGSRKNRMVRVVFWTIVFIATGFILMGLFGYPHRPCRGDFSCTVDIIVLLISVPALVSLIYFVVDATRLCEHFISRLAGAPTTWPFKAISKFSRANNMDPSFVENWLDIHFIAKRTQVVGQLIYFPFIALFITIVARHGYFDNWNFPMGLLIILLLLASFAILSAYVLRKAAEKARTKAIDRLNIELMGLRGQGKKKEPIAQQVMLTIDEVKSIREGAFVPFSQHPIFGAILLPSGGLGALAMLEYVTQIF